MDSVKLIDAAYYSDKDVHFSTTYVADNLNKLSNVSPGEIQALSLLEPGPGVCFTHAGIAFPKSSGIKTATASPTNPSNASGCTRHKEMTAKNYTGTCTIYKLDMIELDVYEAH
jgi:hypothetical protein